jgi:hypothetical protein
VSPVERVLVQARATWLVALLLAACQKEALPAGGPTVTVPQPSPSGAPSAAPAVAASARLEKGPFVFHAGEPRDHLGAYATSYWGPNGLAVFTSPAAVRTGDVADGPGEERLMLIGRYAVIELPERGGYFAHDFGERGWVVELGASDLTGSGTKDVEIRYQLRDEGEDRDWDQWRRSKAEPPEVMAFTHFVVEIWSFRGEQPKRLFAHEYETWASCCGSEVSLAPPRIENSLLIEPGAITLRVKPAWRAEPGTFHVRALDGIPAALTPWGGISEREFRFQGGSFVLHGEH